MPERTILVMASHPLIGRLLVDFARGAGYAADELDTGESPDAAITRVDPSVVLVDYRRADAVSAGVRQRLEERAIPGVLFSGALDRADMEITAGFLRWSSFVMPISQQELASVLERSERR
ncbi:MAG TPA: hypothetical protein VF041_09325 [Gemmatimonadaceae bacterium]